MTKIVTVVGVGALGSHLVQFLRSENVSIRVIDFDRVEQKNVYSQFHSKPGVGKKKVTSLAQSIQMLFGTKIKTFSHKLTNDNQDALLGGDLVIDCLDNEASRILVQAWVRKHEVPCLHGALAPNGSFGRVVWDENFAIDSETELDAATCENGEFLPFIAITSAYLARAAQVFLLEGRKVGFEISPAGATQTQPDSSKHI
tara:strand:- start:77743 stop:78342 length:600 start_codon:yes stop_codon:yes gene_type:complete